MSNHSVQAQSSTDKPLDKDQIHHLLSNSRRRAILNILREEESISRDELVARVCEREYQTDRTRISGEERKRVLVSLHQCHIPKLQDSNVLTETQDRTIESQTNLDMLIPYMDVRQSEGLLQRFF